MSTQREQPAGVRLVKLAEAAPQTGDPLPAESRLPESLAARNDLSMLLSRDEVRDLTERVLGCEDWADDEPNARLTLESCIRMLGPLAADEATLERAVASVITDRARRLSSAIAMKAYELEQMLYGLLPRLDAAFHADASFPLPPGRPGGRPGAPGAVRYHVIAIRGRLQVKVHYQAPSGVFIHLFDVIVKASRRASLWERLETRKRSLPRCVTVHSPVFSGDSLVDLLTWTLQEKNAGGEPGRAAAFAVETLGTAVMRETEAVMSYVKDLSFGWAQAAVEDDLTP